MPAPAGYRLYGNDPGGFAATIATNATIGQPVYSAPGAVFQVFGRADGVRVTDLRTISGDPTDVVTADGQGFIPFYAPAASGSLQVAAVVGGAVSATRTDVFPSDLADVVKAGAAGDPAVLAAAVDAAFSSQLADVNGGISAAQITATAAKTAADAATADIGVLQDGMSNLEPKAGRVGAGAGYVITLQADGSTRFAAPAGGGGTSGGGSAVLAALTTPDDTPLAAGYVNLLGYPMVGTDRVGAIQLSLAIPMIGSAGSVVTELWNAAGKTVVNTMTVPALARRVVAVLPSAQTVNALDRLKARIAAVGATWPGSGVEVLYIQAGTTVPAVTAAPAAVTGLSATASVGQVVLAWTGATGATQYLVTRSGGSGFVVLGLVEATSFTDTAVAAGTTYTYTVYAGGVDAFSAGVTASGTPTAASVGSVAYTGAQIAATDGTHFTRTPQNGTLAAGGTTGTSAGTFTSGATGTSDNPRVIRTLGGDGPSGSVATNIPRTKQTMTYKFNQSSGGMYMLARRNAGSTQGVRALVSYATQRFGQRAAGASATTEYSTTSGAANYGGPNAVASYVHNTTDIYVAEFIDDYTLGAAGQLQLRIWKRDTETRPAAATALVDPFTATDLALAAIPSGMVGWDEYTFSTPSAARGFEVLAHTVVDLAA